MFKVKVEPLGTVGTTKKGGFIRKFLVTFPNGFRDAMVIWSADQEPLSANSPTEMNVCIGDMLFLQKA